MTSVGELLHVHREETRNRNRKTPLLSKLTMFSAWCRSLQMPYNCTNCITLHLILQAEGFSLFYYLMNIMVKM